MSATIKIVNGSYRGTDVSGKVFRFVKGFTRTDQNAFVTVGNDGQFPVPAQVVRIKVDSPRDYEFVSGSEPIMNNPVVQEFKPVETDEEIINRIRERFDILTEMTRAAINGDIRAMIVSGPPGVGKSYNIEREVEAVQLMDTLAERAFKAEVIKGSTSALGLYMTLYKYRDRENLVVFDDCDSVLLDDVALNLLKGALDSGKTRKISWLSNSHVLGNEGIPTQFNFHGSVIFITNMKIEAVKSTKIKDHLTALQSRCHYLDLTLDTVRERILRIKQIANDGELFKSHDLEPEQESAIVEFMEKNQNRVREMSLRMAVKIADLCKAFPDKWQQLAEVTCMRSE